MEKNLILKIQKNILEIQIIQNILERNQVVMQILLKENLLLKIRKNIRIEKDLKTFHLKDLEKINKIKQPLNN